MSLDDARPGSQHFDSIAKLAARLDAELERYANVGWAEEADLAAIGELFNQLREDAGYGLWLRLKLTSAQLGGGEPGTIPGVASEVCALAVDLMDLALLTPADRVGYVKRGELDERAAKLEAQAAMCRQLAALIRAQ